MWQVSHSSSQLLSFDSVVHSHQHNIIRVAIDMLGARTLTPGTKPSEAESRRANAKLSTLLAGQSDLPLRNLAVVAKLGCVLSGEKGLLGKRLK